MTLLNDLEQQFSILSSEITSRISKLTNAEIGECRNYAKYCIE